MTKWKEKSNGDSGRGEKKESNRVRYIEMVRERE